MKKIFKCYGKVILNKINQKNNSINEIFLTDEYLSKKISDIILEIPVIY